MSSNATTLTTYNEHFANYIDGTAQVTSGFQRQWLEYLLETINKDAAILEIGSAFGRDAAFITEQGYTQLHATDAFDAAVDLLKSKGFDAAKLNLLEDEIVGKYALIVASAVFLHFTMDEFAVVLTKIKGALADDGILGFSVKNGDGEEWSDAKMGAPRFFHYWREAGLRTLLDDAGYEVLDFRRSDDDKWLHVACALAK